MSITNLFTSSLGKKFIMAITGMALFMFVVLHMLGNLQVFLGPEVVNTIAWYILSRGDSVVARGPTSLVMRKTTNGWKIVHDHSS